MSWDRLKAEVATSPLHQATDQSLGCCLGKNGKPLVPAMPNTRHLIVGPPRREGQSKFASRRGGQFDRDTCHTGNPAVE